MFTKNFLKKDFDKNFEDLLSSDFNKASINNFIDSNIANKREKSKINNFWNDDDDSSSSIQIGAGKSFLKSSRTALGNMSNIPNKEKMSGVEFENENVEFHKSQSSLENYEEPFNTDFQAFPMTFEGNSDTIMERSNSSKPVGINSTDLKIQQANINNGIETMKSNITSIPIDKSHDEFQYSVDRTEKEEHLLSKVSLMDSLDGPKLDKIGLKMNDQTSVTTTAAVPHDKGFEGDVHNLNRTSESYYKNSINPASGDSYNYTQGITNVTDTIIGDTTAADLAAIHKQYEKYINKSSEELTPETKVFMSETVKDILEDKSYHYDGPSELNLESTINSKSFGLRVINPQEPESQSSPTPTPRPRTKGKLSQVDNMDSEVSILPPNKTNKKVDSDEKQKSSRFSHVKSSGYGTKAILTTTAAQQKDSSVFSTKSQNTSSTRGRLNHQNVNASGKISNQTFVKPQRNQETKSRSKSAPRTNYNGNSPIPAEQNENFHHNLHYGNEDSDNMASDTQSKTSALKSTYVSLKGNEWHEKWLEERKLVKKLQAELMFHDRDFKLQIETTSRDYEAKISQLESQVTRLKQQLQTKPDFTNKSLGPTVTKEDIVRIEKEMKEQSSILVAYEKDNERLCHEIKTLKQHRKGEDKVESIENERLISQLVTVKAELDSKEIELRNLKQIVKENRFSNPSTRGLEGKDFYLQEIGQLKNELRDLNNRYLLCDADKNKAENKLDKAISETEKQIIQYKNELETERVEREKLRESHKLEVEELKRKIKWYLENQAILDQNAKKMKLKDNEIAELKSQLESANTVKISSNIRAKEKLADAAKIKRLEEEIFTLKEDLYSLAKGKNVANVAEKRTLQFLEERIKSLEYDNSNICNKESNALRSLQQQFESVKYQYEEKIRDLELDLKKFDNKNQSDKSIRITELKSKIDELNSELNKKVIIINRLKSEMKKSSNKVTNDDGRMCKEAREKNIRKVDLKHQTSDLLMKQLRDKDVEIERLKIQNNYLKNSSEQRREMDNCVNFNFPSSTQVVELQAENAKLKSQITYLTQEIENCRQSMEDLKFSAIRSEEEVREQYEKRMRELEEYHRGNLNNVKIDYAKRHSESDMGNLQSQIEIQKTYITHLQNQVTDNNVKLKSLESLENELADSKKQIESLNTELSDLRLIWSRKPALEMIDKLRWKINQLEEKENFRGRQLDEFVEKIVKHHTKQYQDEVEKWRSIVTKKNLNLKRIQEELNRLLEALEELKRQGITIPKLDKIII